MSRSRRKTPFMGWSTARSDKPFKVDEHRSERRSLRTGLASGLDPDDRRMNSKSYGDPWLAPKDGKQWIRPSLQIWKWMGK
jgi:hypothetical protein